MSVAPLSSHDVMIIGGGPGGYVCAVRAAQLGLSVLLVEKRSLGGVCLNHGCIPTKTLLKSAEVLELVRKSDMYGVNVDNISVDLHKMVSRARNVVESLSGGINALLKKNGVNVLFGEAFFVGSSKVQVGDIVYTPRNIVVASGGRPVHLDILDYSNEGVWDCYDALHPDKIPEKMAVIGGGAIGVEFSSFYNALGTNVSILERCSRLIINEDEEISRTLQKCLSTRGIAINTDVTVLGAEYSDKGINLQLSNGEILSELDVVLAAPGIIGNTESLKLDSVGIASTSGGHIVVDEYCRTSVDGVWAIGDVAQTVPWLAHKASHEGVLVAEAISSGGVSGLSPVRTDRVPSCVYSIPQVASLGLTEHRAKELGYKCRKGVVPFSANGKAIAIGETEGFVKTLFDEKSGALLGAHMIGHDVTELINGVAIAHALETTEEDLFSVVFPHPTLSETMHESVLAAFSRSLNF